MASRRQISVLCIGSEPITLNLRCALLSKNGCHVLSSSSGHEGVLRFEKEPVDAVVVDLNHDGAESALIISALKKARPQVPVVMLVDQQADLAAGATNQADAVLKKSEEGGRLVDVVRGLTQRH